MKYLNNHLSIVVLLLLCGLFLTACESDPSSPEVEEETIEIPEESTTDANAISKNLILQNAKLISGPLPTHAKQGNEQRATVQIDKDNIKLWPGIKNRIRIKCDGTTFVSGGLMHIVGADHYYEVTAVAEESTDSISVFYIDIDPEDLDLPLSGKIKILPIDAGGGIITVIEDSLKVDTPFDEDTGGGPDGTTPGTFKPALDTNLHWIYTERNGVFETAPGFIYKSSYQTRGCCIDGKSETRCPDYDKVVNVDEQYSTINLEVIKFYSNNDDFIYQLERFFSDYDPKKTDFCTGFPGYSTRLGTAATGGSYSLSPASGFETFYGVTIEDMHWTLDDAVNLGFSPFTQVNAQNPDFEYFLGANFYVERWNIEGGVTLRVFEVMGGDENGIKWYEY
jgi:hypothetical protein